MVEFLDLSTEPYLILRSASPCPRHGNGAEAAAVSALIGSIESRKASFRLRDAAAAAARISGAEFSVLSLHPYFLCA